MTDNSKATYHVSIRITAEHYNDISYISMMTGEKTSKIIRAALDSCLSGWVYKIKNIKNDNKISEDK
jgi:predicted DNA-binding protein